jgi:hypothetical protein
MRSFKSPQRRLVVLAAVASALLVVVGVAADAQAAPLQIRQTPMAPKAPACTDKWTNPRGGDWSTAKDWSTHRVPGVHATACITLSSKSYTVTISDLTGSLTVGKLIVGGTSGRTTQTLKINPSGSDLHVAYKGTSVIQRRGELLLTSAAGGSPFIDGPGALDNYGSLTTIAGKGWSRYLGAPIVNESSGTANFSLPTAAGDIYINNSFTNDGKLNISAGTIANQSGRFSFTEKGGTITNHGTLELNGTTLNKDAGRETGNAMVLNGVTFNDSAGTGSYSVEQSSTLNGNIPSGQTVTVVGDYGTDDQLTLAKTVNHGTFVMTSANIQGPSNSWIVPAIVKGKQAVFNNYGTFKTTNGPGWNRYMDTAVTNERGAHMTLDSGSNTVDVVQGAVVASTLTNDGTLSFGAGAQLALDGPVYGQADFVQNASGTLDVVPSSSVGGSDTTAVLFQPQCGGAGCQNEFTTLGGTVDVASSSHPPTGLYLVYDDNTTTQGNNPTLGGRFAHVDGGYSAVYTLSAQNGSSVQLDHN